jgi:hypothetical protein
MRQYTECPTRYQTRHFFNNSNTNEDIATKFGQEYFIFFYISYTSGKSASNFVAVSSLMLKLLKKCRVR